MSVDGPLHTAALQLEQSRQRLRAALQAEGRPAGHNAGDYAGDYTGDYAGDNGRDNAGHNNPQSNRSDTPEAAAALRAQADGPASRAQRPGSALAPPVLGAARLLQAAAAAWWRGHPLNTAATLALRAGDAALRPLARRQPLALVAWACAAGAVLAWARPWRWLSGRTAVALLVPAATPRPASTLLLGLLPTLLTALIAQRAAASLSSLEPPAPTAAAWSQLAQAVVAALQAAGTPAAR